MGFDYANLIVIIARTVSSLSRTKRFMKAAVIFSKDNNMQIFLKKWATRYVPRPSHGRRLRNILSH